MHKNNQNHCASVIYGAWSTTDLFKALGRRAIRKIQDSLPSQAAVHN